LFVYENTFRQETNFRPFKGVHSDEPVLSLMQIHNSTMSLKWILLETHAQRATGATASDFSLDLVIFRLIFAPMNEQVFLIW